MCGPESKTGNEERDIFDLDLFDMISFSQFEDLWLFII